MPEGEMTIEDCGKCGRDTVLKLCSDGAAACFDHGGDVPAGGIEEWRREPWQRWLDKIRRATARDTG